MKKVLATALALSLAGSAAFAGGPVVVAVEPDPVVVPAAVPTSSSGLVVAGLGLVLLCAIACGSDS
ncbi:MAG: hypothetical protein IAE87_10110 [Rhodobacteraceae bacterium]|nr:hypothetical protein [Paracoccaceae bacterium]